MAIPLTPGELDAMALAHVGHFGMTCQIVRAGASPGDDDFGQPIPGVEAVIYEGACHYVEREEREVVAEINAIISGSVLQLPENADVAPGDRVAWVRDHFGVERASDVGIEHVLWREDGLDLGLEGVA